MIYSLPKTLEIGGRKYDIGWDFRTVLDIFRALNAPELNSGEKALAALSIFYPAFGAEESGMPPEVCEEAVKKCFWFINGGRDETENKKGPVLVDWQQDFPYIVAPVNRILGEDVRGTERLHWWTFLSAFYEIGDCTFAQIVRIRDMKARGKPLNKEDRQWSSRNRDIVDIRTTYTESENELIKLWGGK